MRYGSSPWGQIDHVEELADGIVFVSTASHGGIQLTASRQSEIVAKLGGCYTPFTGSFEWWEEDCDQVIPILVFASELQEDLVHRARQALRSMAETFSDEPKYQAAADLLCPQSDADRVSQC